ncbi:MAG TPA: ABC transporter permease [Thermoanaerobaculia bacterium]|nr:ABC transporter permease [Thermoanaerobaculia bacterium]
MSATNPPTFIIQPTSGWRAIDLGELWAYRELLVIFAWRDLKVRYRQTLLGAIWVMGQPLVTMIIFTLVFNRVAKFEGDGNIPYPLFVLAGVLLWNFVSGAMSQAGNSLIGASFLISKVYFPRLIVPLSNIFVFAVDFFVAALLLIPMMLWYHVTPPVSILLAPLVVLIAAIFALGFGLWIAALNVEYRDVRVIVPFVLQLAMYATPVVYPLSRVPVRFRPLILANPMTGIIETFRSTIFGTPLLVGPLAWSVAASVLVFVGGAFYFRRMEKLFADVL